MPLPLSYPGVYIEEIPSGVRTITGVATSITAFIGRAKQGSVDEPIFINSYGDFERIFGGLWEGSALGFAVRDFYLNGGSQAIIIRLSKNAEKKIFSITVGNTPVTLEAENPGEWANGLEVQDLTEVTGSFLKSLKESLGLAESDKLYNMTIVNKKNGQVIARETFANFIVETDKTNPRYKHSRNLINVLKNQSSFIRVSEGEGVPTEGLDLDTKDLKKEVDKLKAENDGLEKLSTASPINWVNVGASLAKIIPLIDSTKTQLDNLSNSQLTTKIGDNLKIFEKDDLLKEITKIKAPPVTTEELDEVEAVLNKENVNQTTALNLTRKAVTLKSLVETAVNKLPGLKQKLEDAKVKIDDTTGAVTDDVKKVALNSAFEAAKNAFNAANAFLPGASKDGNDGEIIDSGSFVGVGYKDLKKGLYALEKADLFNLICIPPFSPSVDGDYYTSSLIDEVTKYCIDRRAFFLIDPPSDWKDKAKAKEKIENSVGTSSKNAAIYFPRLLQPNPLRDNQMDEFVPCGAIAGVFARTDAQRGVWKAPAGLEATLSGVPRLSVPLTDLENGELNQLGINCLRAKPPAGRIVWGARTREGDDRLASEWKYIPVRRTALFIEESLFRGSQWIVFEPNDEPLWAQIRLNFGAFMNNLFRQGAFQGSSPREAYFVKCDKETTTQNDINLGIVNIVVGFAPLKPAEFVVIKLQQMAGQIEV